MTHHEIEKVADSSHEPSTTELGHIKEDGTVTVIEAGDLEGDEGLHKLGYKAELHRGRGFKATLGLSLTCMAIPYGYGTALATSIYGGGPLTLVWTAAIVTALQWAVAFSLGELASRWPTSAGAYYWTFQLAPKSSRKILSYVNGWLLLIAVLLTTTSVAMGMSQHIVGTVQIAKPEWAPAQWVYVLVAYALLVAASVPLLLGPKFLQKMEFVNIFMMWGYTFAHAIALSARAKVGRRSAKYAFTHYEPQFSGWGDAWTFFIGFLPASYSNCAPGFILSMTEEVKDPAINVPKAMSYTMMPWSLILAWVYILPLTFTMPSSAELLEAPGGIVLPYAYKLVLGNDAGAIVLMFGLLYIGFNCLVGINATASRQLWSFSRDKAVPGSKVWAHATPGGNVPAAIVLCLIIQALLLLISLGSATAFNSFVATAVNGFMAAYALPILLSLMNGRKEVMMAPYSRRLVGLICNIVVMIWAPFALVLYSMPVAIPIDATTMNYSSVVLCGFCFIAAAWYILYARRVYHGPPESIGI